MARQIFVNIPVKDLSKSIKFYESLGFQMNPQFSDEKAASMVVSDTIYVMLLTEPFFKGFTNKEIPDTKKNSQAIIALSADSREQVDKLVDTALKSGGSKYNDTQDHGWMYQHSFADLDGHQWELVYMDETKFPG